MDFFPSGCHFLRLWCLIWSTFYNLIVDLIGSPGSSCLTDVLKLCFGPVFKEKIPFSLGDGVITVIWKYILNEFWADKANIPTSFPHPHYKGSQ